MPRSASERTSFAAPIWVNLHVYKSLPQQLLISTRSVFIPKLPHLHQEITSASTQCKIEIQLKLKLTFVTKACRITFDPDLQETVVGSACFAMHDARFQLRRR